MNDVIFNELFKQSTFLCSTGSLIAQTMLLPYSLLQTYWKSKFSLLHYWQNYSTQMSDFCNSMKLAAF